MALFEALIQDAIKIDFGSEILYGRDQAYISYPIVFPTVTFRLEETHSLTQIAARLGFESCEFYLGLNGYTDSHVDSALVLQSDAEKYVIDLTLEEQDAVYNCLEEQCIKYLDKDCEELLAEARERI